MGSVLIPQYVAASVEKSLTTGAVTPPIANSVPTADGIGGATWQLAGGNVTLADTAGAIGTTLITDGTGPSLSIKRLTTGAGVAITAGAADLTIENTSPATSVTLADAAGATGTSLVTDGVGPALAVRALVGDGANISVAAVAGDARVQLFNQPMGQWRSAPGGVTTFTVVALVSNYLIPGATLTPVNVVSNLITFDANGVGTFGGPVARRVKFTYIFTVDNLAPTGAPRSLQHYVAVNGALTFPNRSFSEVSLPSAGASTHECTLVDSVVLSPSDTFQLAVHTVGNFVLGAGPNYLGVSCMAEGTLLTV